MYLLNLRTHSKRKSMSYKFQYPTQIYFEKMNKLLENQMYK